MAAGGPSGGGAAHVWALLEGIGEFPRELQEAGWGWGGGGKGARARSAGDGDGGRTREVLAVFGGYFDNGTCFKKNYVSPLEAATRRPPWAKDLVRAQLGPISDKQMGYCYEGYVNHLYLLELDSLVWTYVPPVRIGSVPPLAQTMLCASPVPADGAAAEDGGGDGIRLVIAGGYGMTPASKQHNLRIPDSHGSPVSNVSNSLASPVEFEAVHTVLCCPNDALLQRAQAGCGGLAVRLRAHGSPSPAGLARKRAGVIAATPRSNSAPFRVALLAPDESAVAETTAPGADEAAIRLWLWPPSDEDLPSLDEDVACSHLELVDPRAELGALTPHYFTQGAGPAGVPPLPLFLPVPRLAAYATPSTTRAGGASTLQGPRWWDEARAPLGYRLRYESEWKATSPTQVHTQVYDHVSNTLTIDVYYGPISVRALRVLDQAAGSTLLHWRGGCSPDAQPTLALVRALNNAAAAASNNGGEGAAQGDDGGGVESPLVQALCTLDRQDTALALILHYQPEGAMQVRCSMPQIRQAMGFAPTTQEVEASIRLAPARNAWYARRLEHAKVRNRAVLEALVASRPPKQKGLTRMLEIRAVTCGLSPPVSRTILVPADLSLRALADQVVCPAFGWREAAMGEQHLHAFHLRDGTGGARELLLEAAGAECLDAVLGDIEPAPLCFGPVLALPTEYADEEAGAERKQALTGDVMHINLMYGGLLCSDKKAHIGDLLREPSDALELVYDLGDAHALLLTLLACRGDDDESASRAGASGGAPEGGMSGVRLLSGAGAPLPINCGPIMLLGSTFNQLWPPGEACEEAAADSAQPREQQQPRLEDGDVLCVLPALAAALATCVRLNCAGLMGGGSRLEGAAWWARYQELRTQLPDTSQALFGRDWAYHPRRFDHAATLRSIALAIRSPPSTLDRSWGWGSDRQMRSKLEDGGSKQQRQAEEMRLSTSRCLACGATAGLSACAGCKGSKVLFCSKACQALAWPDHKAACKRWREEHAAAEH